MQNLVVFKHLDAEYPLSITDKNGEKWVPAEDVGAALGHSNINNLIKDLTDSGELIDGKHKSKVSLFFFEAGKATKKSVVLSLRGIIRVAMRSQTARAVEFRDWAETVLFDVMTTGFHVSPSLDASLDKKYRGAAIIAKSVSQIGKILGVNEALSKAITVEEIRRAFGLDFSPMLIENKVEEKPLTPTELGKLMNPAVSAREMNRILAENGMQMKTGDEWTPTEKGKPFSFVKTFKAESSEHCGTQLLWFVGVLGAINSQQGEA